MRYTLLVLLIVALRSMEIGAQSRINLRLPEVNPFEEMLPVELCKVTANPQHFDGKMIRIRARYQWTFESAALLPYDSKGCWDWMRIGGYDCVDGKECKALSRQLRLRRGDSLKPVQIPVLLSGRFSYRRFLTALEVRYGFHHYEFVVTNFEGMLEPPPKQDSVP